MGEEPAQMPPRVATVMRQGVEVLIMEGQHTDAVNDFSVIKGAREWEFVVTCSSDRTIRVWKLHGTLGEDDEPDTAPTPESGTSAAPATPYSSPEKTGYSCIYTITLDVELTRMAWDAVERRVFVGTTEGRIRILRLDDSCTSHTEDIPILSPNSTAIVFLHYDPVQQCLIAVNQGQYMLIHDFKTSLKRSVLVGSASSDGPHAQAAGSTPRNIAGQVANNMLGATKEALSKFQTYVQPYIAPEDPFTCAAYDPVHHRLFLSTQHSSTIEALDLSGRKLLGLGPHVGVVTALHYDPVEEKVYAGTSDKTSYVWKMAPPGKEVETKLLAQHKTHEARITAVFWCPGMRHFFQKDTDKKLMLTDWSGSMPRSQTVSIAPDFLSTPYRLRYYDSTLGRGGVLLTSSRRGIARLWYFSPSMMAPAAAVATVSVATPLKDVKQDSSVTPDDSKATDVPVGVAVPAAAPASGASASASLLDSLHENESPAQAQARTDLEGRLGEAYPYPMPPQTLEVTELYFQDLLNAISRADVTGVTFLLGQCIDIDRPVPGTSLDTPLHVASARGVPVDVMRMLVDQGKADVMAVNATKATPLHVCSSVELSSYLVNKCQADPNAKDQFGRTPLHYATRHGKAQVESLARLDHVDINAVDDDGCTPLHWAIRFGTLDVVHTLLHYRANPNTVDAAGHLPLLIAMHEPRIPSASGVGEAKAVSAVPTGAGGGSQRPKLAAGAESSAVPPSDRKDEGAAAERVQLAMLLLRYGAKAHAVSVDEEKTTPLHCAAYLGAPTLVQELVTKGADPTFRNAKDQLAVDVALTAEIAEFLQTVKSRTAVAASEDDETDVGWMDALTADACGAAGPRAKALIERLQQRITVLELENQHLRGQGLELMTFNEWGQLEAQWVQGLKTVASLREGNLKSLGVAKKS